jgi:hypothetical protein
MKKLRLDIDSLQVESFDLTADQDSLRGTVDGQQIIIGTRRVSECIRCLETNQSCFISCAGSCLASCAGTCDCPQPSDVFTDCGCPIRTQFCDTRLCPIEDTVRCGTALC